MRHLVTLAIISISASARADGEPFGTSQTLSISSGANLSAAYVSAPGNASNTTFAIEPSADFFVARNVSLGGFVLLSSASTSIPGMPDVSSTSFGIGPRVGYNVALADKLSFWPKLGLSYVSTSIMGTSSSVTQLTVFAPLLYHPARHFFVGLGPELNANLTGDAKTTTFALAFTLGGWI